MGTSSLLAARQIEANVKIPASEWAAVRHALAAQEQASRSRTLFALVWAVIFSMGAVLFAAAEPLGLVDLLSADVLSASVVIVIVAGVLLLAALLQQFRLDQERARDILNRYELQSELDIMQRDMAE